jgi:SAM-dependent methyltransferase
MKNSDKNIVYYNAIANEYDDMLNNDRDHAVREKVARKFSALVTKSKVLDFGGGTGLDLPWLTEDNETVFFCEPSTPMREKAIHNRGRRTGDKVIFLDDQASDFRQWHLRLPFTAKVDAVLSNFAVLNCIPDLPLLFRNVAMVVKPGGDMILLVLNRNLKKMLKGNLTNIIKSFMSRQPTSINIRYNEHRQTVYIHSIKEIIKASNKYFSFCGSELLPASGFTFIHLKRK